MCIFKPKETVTVELWHHSLHDVLKYAGGGKWNQEKNRSVSTFSGGLDSKVDPTRIHADLTDVYGEHSVLYWTVCRWIIQGLEVGKWTEVKCRPCCLILAWNEQTFPWVKQVITEIPHISVSAVGSRSDLFRRTVEKNPTWWSSPAKKNLQSGYQIYWRLWNREFCNWRNYSGWAGILAQSDHAKFSVLSPVCHKGLCGGWSRIMKHGYPFMGSKTSQLIGCGWVKMTRPGNLWTDFLSCGRLFFPFYLVPMTKSL